MQSRSPRDADTVFAEVLQAEWAVLVKMAQKFASNSDEVNDILQEAATKTYAAWRRGRVDDLPRYLTVVVRNTAFGLRRRQRTEAACLERLLAVEGTSSLMNIEHPDDGRMVIRDDVRAALQRLSPTCREILEMRVIDEWPVDDVAAKLFIAPGTVKSRCHRCLKQLGRLLDSEDHG